MQDNQVQFANPAELRSYVHRILCERENLLAEQFVTREQPLLTRGQITAYQFQLKGPRAIKLSAIWTLQQNAIIFYDTQGERFFKVSAVVAQASLPELQAG
jgi:hypothetical protein